MKKLIVAGTLTLVLSSQAGAFEWWEVTGDGKRPLTMEELADLPPQPDCLGDTDISLSDCLTERGEWDELADARWRQTDEEEAERREEVTRLQNEPEPHPSFWRRLGFALLTGLAAGASSYEPPRYDTSIPPPQPSPFLIQSFADDYVAESARFMAEHRARRADRRAERQALEQTRWRDRMEQEARRARVQAEIQESQRRAREARERQDHMLEEARRPPRVIDPGFTPYPCSFIRRNARA